MDNPELDTCPDCGAIVKNGRAGCQALFDEMAVLSYSDLRYAAGHDLAFDTYCMQHVEVYGRSAKSYAAHLTRLCCGLEYDGRTAVYTAIQQWLNGQMTLAKPEILTYRGRLTIVDVAATPTPEEHTRLVQAWAANVWEAYASQHEFARHWIRQALATKEGKR